MLSRGYLQPFRNVLWPVEENRGSSAELFTLEQQILNQERALKVASGPKAKVSTKYRYSVGPDGRLYITEAEVSIKSEEDDGKKVNLGKKAQDPVQKSKDEKGTQNVYDGEAEAAVRELKRIEQEVVSHEAAHQAAGGSLAGAASYTYTQGPDGRNYITGGEVPIQLPVSNDPEQTLRDMEQVQRAALAPGNPSGQDAGVAGKAAVIAAQARQEIASNVKKTDKDGGAKFSPGISSVKAGLLFEYIRGAEGNAEGYTVSPIVEELPNSTMLDPMEAYGRNASSRGLWTLRRGFEPATRTDIYRSSFEIAA